MGGSGVGSIRTEPILPGETLFPIVDRSVMEEFPHFTNHEQFGPVHSDYAWLRNHDIGAFVSGGDDPLIGIPGRSAVKIQRALGLSRMSEFIYLSLDPPPLVICHDARMLAGVIMDLVRLHSDEIPEGWADAYLLGVHQLGQPPV